MANDDPFLMMERLQASLAAEEESSSGHIITGRFKSFEDYKEAVGYIRGIKKAQSLLMELVDAVKDQ